ncbi:MAG: UvrB/UvrC motif-containing protein [Simkaniaceae bacterium]|nr:UvrB/UvrC motif-containing protein [Simkaniaceae bacterium]
MSERPLECSQCKRPASVIYSEMVDGNVITTQMCQGCPILKHKLQGTNSNEESPKKEEGLCCSNCHTTLESVLVGEPLGCKECFSVFQDILTDQLFETESISPKLNPNPATPVPTLHIGKSPHIDPKAKTSNRIRDLNESLKKALKKENYEEAAWLRDQINELMEVSDERS